MKTNSKQKAGRFASRWGFILASVGSAVGMANVWGFPNKMGSNGGGAFLLIYLFFIFIFSYVGLPAEFAIGRRAKTGTLGSYENAWRTRGEKAGKAGGLLHGFRLLVALYRHRLRGNRCVCAQSPCGFRYRNTDGNRRYSLV